MPYTILLKRNATPGAVPTPASLSLGELALNTGDGLLYYLDGSGSYSGTVRAINADSASYAATASFLFGSILSASFATTAAFALNGGTGGSGGLSPTGTFTGSFTGAFQGTASFALNANTASFVNLARSASWVETSGSTQQFVFLNGRHLSGSSLLFVSGGGVVASGSRFIVSHSVARFLDVIELQQVEYSFPTGSDVTVGKVLTVVSGSNILATRTGWTVGSGTTSPSIFSQSIDNNQLTRWTTGIAQVAGQSYHVQFDNTQSVAGFIMDTQNSANDFPLVFALSSSIDSGSTWTPRGTFSGSSFVERTFFPFDATNILFRIVQPNGSLFWSIHEFNVYSARTAFQLGWRDVSGSVPLTSSYALQAGTASVSRTAITASYALLALSASYAPGAPSVSASYAETASFAISASWAPGGTGAALAVDDENVPVLASATKLNFTGAGVTATASGSTVNITVPGAGGLSRGLIFEETPSLSANQIHTGSISGFGKSFILFSVNVNTHSRVRLYSSQSYQIADLGRAIGTDPTSSEPGIIVDLVLS